MASALIIFEVMGPPAFLPMAATRFGEIEFARLLRFQLFDFSFSILSLRPCTSLPAEGELVDLANEMGGELRDRDWCRVGVNLQGVPGKRDPEPKSFMCDQGLFRQLVEAFHQDRGVRFSGSNLLSSSPPAKPSS